MKPKRTWQCVEITVASNAAEAAEFALGEFGTLGTHYGLLEPPDSETVAVTGYFTDPISSASIEASIEESLTIHGLDPGTEFEIAWKTVEEQDWLAEWKKYWKPTFTEKFVVAPPWEDVDPGDRLLITIEPNMAFGTGTHETTRLCLRAIENFYSAGSSFFDVGTGTGILAIAAALMQQGSDEKEILACDTDSDAVAIAEQNALMNDAGSIRFFTGTIDTSTPVFDFVCANLTAGVIIPLLSLLLEKTRRVLVLSGVLAEQEDMVLKALEKQGNPEVRVQRDGEWISMMIEKD